jgi:hypothetical protein
MKAKILFWASKILFWTAVVSMAASVLRKTSVRGIDARESNWNAKLLLQAHTWHAPVP